jgi:mannose-1-phosphate guanylyltransferase
MLHAVIMAGGAGTRFWPASRAALPKQLLALVGQDSMLRQTVDRLDDLVTPDRTLIVTNERLVRAVGEQLPELPPASIVGEPCKRDTAPCIGLAAVLVSRTDPDATMAVLPADHVIRQTERFQAAVRQAVGLVQKQPDRIVTFGIRPTYPAEVFGYIQRGARIDTNDDAAPTFVVKRFREKPNLATATEYLASGDYYWNSGIFIWKAKTVLAALAQHQPEMLAHLQKIGAAWGTPDQEQVFKTEFTAIKGISIDYAVMEHAKNIAVIEAPYDWDDLGSWQSLARLAGADHLDNTVIGRHLGHNTRGTIVRTTDDHLVVTIGLEDCLVVHTPDATLVARKQDEEAVREIVKQLEARGWKEHL